MQWGVWFEPIQPVRRLVQLARQAERLGASVCLIADEGTDRDVYVAITAVLLATEHIVVSPGITNPVSRHPVTTAAAIASLAELAPGRVWLGLGTGGERVLDPLGLPENRPYSRLKEALDVTRRLLAGEQVGPARLPWTPGPVPVLIAGRGPRVLKLAAAEADWALLSAKPIADIATEAGRIRANGPARIAFSAPLAYDQAERNRVLRHLAFDAVRASPAVRSATGIDDDFHARIAALVSAGQVTAAADLLPDALVDHFAIAGAPDQCAAALARLQPHFDMFVLPINHEPAAEKHIHRSAEIIAAAGD